MYVAGHPGNDAIPEYYWMYHEDNEIFNFQFFFLVF